MTKKILFRVDGNNRLGMGDIFSMINLAKKLNDFEILFISKYIEGINKVKESGYKVEEIPDDISLKEEIEIIKKINGKFKPNFIAVELIRDDYQEYCKELFKINKTLVVDFFGNIEVYSDVLLNYDIFPKNQKYIKKNENTIYCLGPKYSLLKENIHNYHNIDKLIRDKVENILITFGGADPRNLTPRVINTLKNLNDIKFTIIIGSAFRNTKEIKNILKSINLKFEITENSEDITQLMYDADLVICSGGVTSLELCAVGTPFLGISNAEWEADRLNEMEKIGICRYIGNWDEFNEEKLFNTFKSLIYDKEERVRMSINGKNLLDGKGTKRMSNIIRNIVEN